MNPMNMIKQYVLQGLTPKGILSRMNITNPMLNNIMNMAERGDTNGVETFARNICKQRGLDFDKEFSRFRNSFK